MSYRARWAAAERSGEGVVDDGNELVLLAELRGFREVDEAHGGFVGLFHVQDARAGVTSLQCRRDRCRRDDFDSEVGEDVAHQAIRAAVELCGGN